VTGCPRRTTALSRLLTVYLLGCGFALCALPAKAQPAENPLGLTPAEQAWVAAHPVLRVAATPDWPPFEYIDEAGAYKGISADILRYITAEAGLTIEPVPGAWSDLYRRLRNRELDLAPAMQKSPERATQVLFSRPVLNFPHAVYTHRDRAHLATMQALSGKRVAVERDYYEHEYLKANHPELDVLPVDNALQALIKVASGDADAYIGNVAVASYLIDKNVLTNIHMGDYATMGQLELSIGVRSDYGTLVSILDKGIAALSPEDKRAMVSRYTVTAPAVTLSAAEMAWIQEHPVIRLGIDPEFAPFEFLGKDGVYAGMASDYVHLLNARTGLNLEVVHTTSWDDAVAAFQAGDLDVLPCIGKNAARQAYLNYTEPYLSFHRVVITRLDAGFVGGPEDLAGMRVAVQRDSSHDAFLQENAPNAARPYDTFEETLTAVARGEVDCAIGNAATTAYWIKRLGLTNLRLTVPMGESVETLHLGVRKDWPQLLSILNKGLASIPEEEALAIRTKWMDIKVDSGVNLRRVWGIASAITALLLPVLLFITWHNRRLRKEIISREIAERAMRASEVNYRTLVESANSIIMRMDPIGTIRFINAFGERFLGFSNAELIGKNLVGTIVPYTETSGRDLEALMQALVQNPEHFAANENENITKDGRRVWIAWTNRPLYDETGALEQVLCVGNDVTVQRMAVDALKRYEFIINTVKEMMSIVNAEGCYEAVNDEWCSATGIARQTALGQPVSSVWTEKTASTDIWPRLAQCLAGELVHYESVIDMPARGQRHCEVTMYPFVNQQRGTTHAIVVAQDVTERKAVEAALKRAMEAAEAGTKAKSAFLANMSHEIRTPLNAVLGYTQLLQRSLNLSPDQRHAVDAIQRSGDHLLSLINDILELSRIEAGRVEIVPSTFSVAQLLSDLEIMFRAKVDAKGLQLHVVAEEGLSDCLKADRNRVSQVLINLVGNALKFTSHGSITVRARALPGAANPNDTEDGALHLCFEVEDTGCGIAPTDLDRIFDSFEQSGAAGLRQGGTGLGLSICKHFAALMDGDISVTSVLGAGSRFTFTLRAEEGDALALPSATTPRHVRRIAADQAPPRVLIVDDRDTNRDLLCRILHELGFETREAVNGLEALQVFEDWSPQIVLIDLVMPVMDGREAIRRLRARPGGGDGVAIIALTASTLDDERMKVLADGADAFLRKPFREDELLEEIRKHAGVKFEYDNEDKVMSDLERGAEEASAAIQELPAELLEKLQSVLLRGAIGEAKTIAEEVRTYNEGLANLIARRAREYRLNELQSFFN
jgi:PAS domain S-box-containing protein